MITLDDLPAIAAFSAVPPDDLARFAQAVGDIRSYRAPALHLKIRPSSLQARSAICISGPDSYVL